MSDEGSGFSGVTIVIFIACGVLTFFLLLLLSKRSITRFALKNRRGPHVPIGYNAPKSLRREIENRLNRIPELSPEPKSLLPEVIDSSVEDRLKSTFHYYRLKTVDDIKAYEYKVRDRHPNVKRRYNEPLRNYLLNSLVGASPGGKKVKLIHKICDMYDHARHDPKDFSDDDYNQFVTLLQELQQCTVSTMTLSELKGGVKRLQKNDIKQGHSSTHVPMTETSRETLRWPLTYAEKEV